MEIRPYVEPLIRWWKLILVACLLAGISSFLVVMQQPPSYETRTTLVIGRAVYEPNPRTGELDMATQLASYYANIAQREVVRNATMAALGLQWLPEYTARAVPNSQLIEISVTDTDPRRAQAVANELANQLIKQSPSNPTLEEQKHAIFVNDQLNLLQSQITQTLEEIAQKEAELGGLNSARQIADMQQEIASLQQKLTTLQTNYAQMLSNSTGRAMNSMTVVEPAGLPRKPVSPNRVMVVVMSIAIAFLISAGTAYILEYMDDTFKSPEEIMRALNLPVIGYISEMEEEAHKGSFVIKNPKSPISEAFRSLRLNLEFIDADKFSKIFLVASVGQTEGKSVVVTNLAMTMAQGCKKVILMDADLRKPSVHRYLGLENNKGLSDVFRGVAAIDDVAIPYEEEGLEPEGLKVILSGSPVPNPTDLLGSRKMDAIFDELRHTAEYIFVDGPPALLIDSTVMATRVDAVIMVIGYGYTRKSEAQAAFKQLNHVGAEFAGVVLNRIPIKNKSYYKLYHYYYGAEDEATPKPKSWWERLTRPRLNMPLRNPLKSKNP